LGAAAGSHSLAGPAVGGLVAGAFGVDIENTVTYQSFALLLALLLFLLCEQFFLSGRNFGDALVCRVSARQAIR